jgi:hypothetical protein
MLTVTYSNPLHNKSRDTALEAERAAQEGGDVEEDPDAALLWALRQL